MTTPQLTVRRAQPADKANILSAIGGSGLFPPDGLGYFDSVLDEQLADSQANEHRWILSEKDGAVVGTAYYAPERMTDGTWNTFLIAVTAEQQGKGFGAAMMHYIEQTLAQEGVRVLLVETSGLPSFKATRAFYKNKMQYDEEGRIREFYQAGEDKVIFRKALN